MYFATCDYIPDITERFPEGFRGVDMTDSFSTPRRIKNDLWDFSSEAELVGYDDIPYENEEE